MTFKKYQHIEKFGNDEVQGIELGVVYVFPKLDGTNSSLWKEQYEIIGIPATILCGGSRNRQLSIENDNAGFLNASSDEERLMMLFDKNPNLRLYGEWMVPHTLRTYREDVWKKFWIFDVMNDETGEYLSYDAYKPLLEEFGLDFIPPLAIIKNGSYEQFIHVLGQNNFFIKNGEGTGEGIVIKNYDFYNRFGNQVWAKIVTSEFKEKHYKEMGPPETEGKMVEEEFAGLITRALCDKTKCKILLNDAESERQWTSKDIPELLNRVYYDLITEETWNFLKENKNPTVNFKTLKALCINRVKELMPEVF